MHPVLHDWLDALTATLRLKYLIFVGPAAIVLVVFIIAIIALAHNEKFPHLQSRSRFRS
jgi:NADH:ubiquinone oxidoreductase subunit 6 (subunit J)